jgi:1-deoxy-D-xylulose-5-phosphate reductoisomerase
MPSSRQRTVTILGSTGSIGTQALDVIGRNRDRFEVHGLAATGRQPQVLAQQVLATGARRVALADEASAPAVHTALRALGATGVRLTHGPQAVAELAAEPVDVVLNGLAGAAGLPATLAALRSGSTLALANKESLIIAGPLVARLAAPGQIVPVDSEHSALAQALRSGSPPEVSRLILTASGGPFRGRSRAELAQVTPRQALAHPTWSMGPLVTINSSTLVNKGLEIIEAHLLFDIPMERVEAVVHPQSVVHSIVEFVDGSCIAQASPPDMRLPIALGLAWPDRVPGAIAGIDWSSAARWDFGPIDHEAFPAVGLARTAGAAGGTAPAVFNAANEVAVQRFLDGEIGYLDIAEVIGEVLTEHLRTTAFRTSDEVRDVDVVLRADAQARLQAASWKPQAERRP